MGKKSPLVGTFLLNLKGYKLMGINVFHNLMVTAVCDTNHFLIIYIASRTPSTTENKILHLRGLVLSPLA
jgi:hypothetical protein